MSEKNFLLKMGGGGGGTRFKILAIFDHHCVSDFNESIFITVSSLKGIISKKLNSELSYSGWKINTRSTAARKKRLK